MYRLAVIATTAVLALSACGSDDNGASVSGDTAGSDATEETLTIDDAWTRTTPEGAERTAVYLTVETTEADELVGASVSADVAAAAELHETVTDAGDEEGMNHEEEGGGVTSMRAVEVVPVPVGTTVFEPGGYHIMLMGLAAPLVDGDTFELSLDFENAGTRTVVVDVRAG